MSNNIICDCGASISKKNINVHKRSKKHQEYINGLLEEEQELLASDNTNKNKIILDDTSEEQSIQEEQSVQDEDEVHIEEKPKVKSKGQSAEHMEKIRVKAREAIPLKM